LRGGEERKKGREEKRREEKEKEEEEEEERDFANTLIPSKACNELIKGPKKSCNLIAVNFKAVFSEGD
jgi:hypothetical protein